MRDTESEFNSSGTLNLDRTHGNIIIYDPERQTVLSGGYFEIATLILNTNSPTVDVFSSVIQETGGRDNG